MKNLKSKLKNIINTTDNNLTKHVAEYVLEDYKTDEEIKGFFNDLSYSGCQSGMINHLIYYTDTKKFFDEYSSEIEDLKEELEDSMGEPLKIKGNIANWLAWFGFEETARNIAQELGID